MIVIDLIKKQFLNNDYLNHKSLENTIKLLYSCTSYNFNMSYFEIETEINPNQY